MQDNTFTESLEKLPGFTETLPSALLNAYLDNSLNATERLYVEAEIGRNKELRALYENKLLEKNFIFNSIPNRSPSKEELENINLETAEVIRVTLDSKSENVLKKVWRFLDTPII